MFEEIRAKLKEEQANNVEAGTEAVLELNWNSFDSHSRNIAIIMSLFSSEPIPCFLLESVACKIYSRPNINETCLNLFKRNWLLSSHENCYQMQEQVREWIKKRKISKLPKDTIKFLKEIFCQEMVAIARGISKNFNHLNLEEIENLGLSIPHIYEAVTEHRKEVSNHESVIYLFTGLARYYQQRISTQEKALFWYEQQLYYVWQNLDPDNPILAGSLESLAEFYKLIGKSVKSEFLYELALTLRRRLLGDKNPDTISCMENLAGLYRSRCKDAEAESLYQQIREMKKQLEFDVFLCHNSQDKLQVIEIARELQQRGIKPWLDIWELRPGFSWQQALQQQITSIKSAAIFVGESGIGPWQDMEIQAFLNRFVKQACPVIPIWLKNVPNQTSSTIELPIFLQGITWVDFRRPDPEPISQLIWGITGVKPVQ